MTKINANQDSEQIRYKRNLTEPQKKNIDVTKEGIVVNNFLKDQSYNTSDMYDTMVISDGAKMPKKIYENHKRKEKNLMPITLVSTGVMATIALITSIVKKSAKISLDPAKKLPTLTRNLAINEETHQAIYQLIQTPNQKTFLAGAGVLAISAMAFMGKMFIDGLKDIWVKKREADIQKNLQENLIEVETQAFSGKIQIVRSMLAGKAREFSEYLSQKPMTIPAFKNLDNKLNFTSNEKQENTNSNNLKYFAFGASTLAAIVSLGFISMKNVRAGKKYIDDFVQISQKRISEIVQTSTEKTKEIDRKNLKNLFQSIDANENYIKTKLEKLNWENTEKQEFIKDLTFEVTKSTAQADKAIGGDGTPKPAFYSHVNDYRAFFYNWLLESKNPQFKQLFFGITGISAISYGGKVLGEGLKEIEVKKMNANTELELQQRLVSTELRNFKAKKDSAINPLTEEFYTQLQRGKPKDELKTIAENILFEVKNGPPFVYS